MVVSGHHLEKFEGAIHVLEALVAVPTAVVIHSQGRVTVGNLGIIEPEEALLKDNRLCLQLNGLKVISKLVLNAGNLSDALGDLLVHGA